VVITSRSGAASQEIPEGVRVRRWDAQTGDDLLPEVESVDAIVHLAGENIGDGRWTASRRHRILASRVDSTAALTEVLRGAKRKPQVILQASAVGIYGSRGDEELSENEGLGRDFLAQVCGAWETASAEVPALGVRRVIARIGVVLSRDGGALPRMALPFRLFAGGPIGSGRQWVSWIHIEDLVAAMMHLLVNENLEGCFNLCAPHPVTNRDLSKALGRVLQRPSLFPVPAFLLRLMLGEMAGIVLEGQRAVPSRLGSAGYSFRFPKVEAALHNLYQAD
jgi:uncharacterized protein (TIGR01777 family)